MLTHQIVALAGKLHQAREVAERHDVPRWFDDGIALLDEVHPAGVSIATAAGGTDLAVAALTHECRVLLEKPVAATETQAAKLLSADPSGWIQPRVNWKFSGIGNSWALSLICSMTPTVSPSMRGRSPQ